MQMEYKLKRILSWSFYDWANSAFATTVIAAFFPIFFKEYWSSDIAVTESTFYLGMANSLAGIIVAVMSPILGAIADRGGTRKKFLLFFTMMGIVMTGSLYFVSQGAWIVAIIIYTMATVGFSSGNLFYDSLLLDVAIPQKRDFVSSLGLAMGYLGGGLLFAFNVIMTLNPEFFGLQSSEHAVRVSFIIVAVWWALFSLPILFFVKESKSEKEKDSFFQIIISGFIQIRTTLKDIRRHRTVFLFLAGYWLYIDGVDTIIRMAVDYGMSIGFDSNSLILALLITQFVGFPSTILFGKIGEVLGAKIGIFLAIGVYIGVCIWGYFMKDVSEFYVLAVVIGLVQGGIQSLSRSLFSRLIPQDRAAEFFGFYNMLGKMAVVIGPILMGWIGLISGNPRYSILSIILLFILGAFLLYFVDEKRA